MKIGHACAGSYTSFAARDAIGVIRYDGVIFTGHVAICFVPVASVSGPILPSNVVSASVVTIAAVTTFVSADEKCFQESQI